MTAAATRPTGGRVLLATQVFPADMGALFAVRVFVETWGAKVGLSEWQMFGMKLAASEACANAIEHPEEHSDLTLWAWDRGDRFTVDVWHAGSFRVKTTHDRRYRSMGLPLMVASVDEVLFSCLPEGGTRVSFSVFLGNAERTDLPET